MYNESAMKMIPKAIGLRFVIFLALLSLAAGSLFAEDIIYAKRKERLSPGAKINFDFSKMNYNMAAGVVFDMMVSPGDYEGKTAKITGQFTSEIHEGKRIFAVIMWDATGCCPTGLSVVPLEGKKYPADFPAEKSTVTVTGVLESIEMFGGWSLCLVADSWN